MLNIQANVPLSKHSTMRLGGPAAYLAEITDKDDIADAATWANEKNLPIIVIGDGSNIVWTDNGFPGLVLVDKLKGFEIDGETVTFAGGENWDEVVKRTVDAGLSGLEFLSLIPGTAGATPVQNVGAYGQEIANVLVSLEACDLKEDKSVKFSPADCQFGYRTSRFKVADHGRFFITSVTVKLKKANPAPPFYESLQKYLDEKSIHEYSPEVLRQAVIALRSAKLPDPAKTANNGSFFANPVVSQQEYQQIVKHNPGAVSWPAGDGQVKLSAAWLIEAAGFKDKLDTETGMTTWPNQALVLVNQSAKNTADLLKFKQKIIDKVENMFGVSLKQEPELLGS